MSRPTVAKLMCYLTALLPFFCADIATILYLIGGFGGGHGRFDNWIFSLGCPASLPIMHGLLLPPFELHDLLAFVWYPAVLNFIFCWAPIAFVMHLLTRRWQSAWQSPSVPIGSVRVIAGPSAKIIELSRRLELD